MKAGKTRGNKLRPSQREGGGLRGEGGGGERRRRRRRREGAAKAAAASRLPIRYEGGGVAGEKDPLFVFLMAFFPFLGDLLATLCCLLGKYPTLLARKGSPGNVALELTQRLQVIPVEYFSCLLPLVQVGERIFLARNPSSPNPKILSVLNFFSLHEQ